MGEKQKAMFKDSPSAAIRQAIWSGGMYSRAGYRAFHEVLIAPDHTLACSELEAKFGTPNLHLGAFCKRVAEQLGVHTADEYALFERNPDATGKMVLTVKGPIVTALTS